jgi:uncharacterized protein (DUF302 family)
MNRVLEARVNAGFSHTLTATKEALVSQGLQVMSQVDIRAAVETDCDTPIDPYVVLGAYIPDVVVAAVGNDPSAALFCMFVIVVRGDGDGTKVETYNPATFLSISDHGASGVGAAGERLEAAMAELASGRYDDRQRP